MKYRRLGASGLKVSEICLGAWINFGERIASFPVQDEDDFNLLLIPCPAGGQALSHTSTKIARARAHGHRIGQCGNWGVRVEPARHGAASGAPAGRHTAMCSPSACR